MIIPHSKAEVRQIKIPWLWLRICGCLCMCTILLVSYLYWDYGRVKSNLPELYHLREVNESQQMELENLADQAAEVQEKIYELGELEEAIEEYLGSSSSRNTEGAARPAGLVASRSQGTEGRLRAAGSLIARGGSLENDPAPADASKIKVSLTSAEEQLDVSRENLQGLLQSLKERQAYLNAKPSIWPLQGKVTSRYGYRKSPFTGRSSFHDGIDIAAPIGTPIRAAASGVVTYAGWRAGYGQTVMLEHGYGFRTLYGHNSRLAVKKGARVEKGDIIAYVGNTGQSTGPHLHYEVYVNGKRQNPANYLP